MDNRIIATRIGKFIDEEPNHFHIKCQDGEHIFGQEERGEFTLRKGLSYDKSTIIYQEKSLCNEIHSLSIEGFKSLTQEIINWDLCSEEIDYTDTGLKRIKVVSIQKTGDCFPNQFEGKCSDGDYIYIRQRKGNLIGGKAPREVDAIDAILLAKSTYRLFDIPMNGYCSISIEELKKFTSYYLDWRQIKEET